jgi:RimJ/RimL family protein N-acetyltransferase
MDGDNSYRHCRASATAPERLVHAGTIQLTPSAVELSWQYAMLRETVEAGACMKVIQTERLELRQLVLNDAAFILELLNEAAFLRFIGDKGVTTLASAREYILKGPMDSYGRYGFGMYAACLADGTPTGICGLVKRDGLKDVDVGFAFLSRHCLKGYAVETASAVLAHARQVLQLHRVVAITTPDNVGSIAVLEKIGLKFERMIRLTEHSPELKLFGPGYPGSA